MMWSHVRNIISMLVLVQPQSANEDGMNQKAKEEERIEGQVELDGGSTELLGKLSSAGVECCRLPSRVNHERGLAQKKITCWERSILALS